MSHTKYSDNDTGAKTPILSAVDEESGFNLPYPTPLSLNWRIAHWIGYIIGGSTFAIGSAMYFPAIADYVSGGWLFTIGSAGFAFADLYEWWMNNRVGCFNYERYNVHYEKAVRPYFDSPDTVKGQYQRAENGMNFFFSFIGSTLYLIGSILFIPATNSIVMGTYVFIFGSLVIFLSQSWKVYRAGCFNEDTPSNRNFQLTNLSHDVPAFLVDSTAGLGGLAYCVGSILFLPQYDVNDTVTWAAALWFELGGILFFLSGVAMFYRYFYTELYPH